MKEACQEGDDDDCQEDDDDYCQEVSEEWWYTHFHNCHWSMSGCCCFLLNSLENYFNFTFRLNFGKFYTILWAGANFFNNTVQNLHIVITVFMIVIGSITTTFNIIKSEEIMSEMTSEFYPLKAQLVILKRFSNVLSTAISFPGTILV